MFYATGAISKALRFGDVVSGFVTCTPRINDSLNLANDMAII